MPEEKDFLKELGVSPKVEKALRVIRDEALSTYEAKIVTLEADLKAAQHQVEGNSFASTEKAQPFEAFYLDRWCSEVDEKELGRLQAAFLKEFAFYNLLIRTHIANDARGSVEIMVVRARSCMDHRSDPMTREEYAQMRLFVRGFFAGVRAFRKKPRRLGS